MVKSKVNEKILWPSGSFVFADLITVIAIFLIGPIYEEFLCLHNISGGIYTSHSFHNLFVERQQIHLVFWNRLNSSFSYP